MEPNQFVPKWLTVTLGVLLVVFLALLVVDRGTTLRARISDYRPQNTISVSGEGKVTGRPDLATVSIGVLSQGKTAVEVKDENNRKLNAIIALLKDQGIPKEDITTTEFYFNPTQDWTGGKPVITGYQGNQAVTVKVRNVDKSQDQLEKVLDGGVNAGANQLQGVQLTFSDPDGLRQEARKLAIAKAKEKAQELAAEAGLKLGKVVSVSESGTPTFPPVPYGYGGADALRSSAGAAEKSVAPDIQTGTQEISEVMTVVFELK